MPAHLAEPETQLSCDRLRPDEDIGALHLRKEACPAKKLSHFRWRQTIVALRCVQRCSPIPREILAAAVAQRRDRLPIQARPRPRPLTRTGAIWRRRHGSDLPRG